MVVLGIPTDVVVVMQLPIEVLVAPADDAALAAAAAAATLAFFCWAMADVRLGFAPIITRNSW